VLLLTHRVPHPPNRGDRIRTYHILRHLAASCDVSLGCLADEPVSRESLQELNRLCRDVCIVPVQPRLRWIRAGWSFMTGGTVSVGAFRNPNLLNVVRSWSRESRFDAALCSSSALAQYFQVDELRTTPRFVDLIDVDSEKWHEYAAASSGPRRWLFQTEATRLRNLETQLADWTRGIAVVSEPEARLYRSFCPHGPVEAISNGVDVDYFQPAPSGSPASGCVFVGALDYRPNIDGICWFAREIWPEVHRRFPDQTLNIVGREPVPEVRALEQISGVFVPGTVPDVRPWLNSAAVAVAPLRIARGVQNKVLEALAMGRAVVASPDPLVGLSVRDGLHLLKASSRDQWIEQISRLLGDSSLRDELGQAGQAWVTAHHRWEQCLEPLLPFLGLAGGKPLTSAAANASQDSLARPVAT